MRSARHNLGAAAPKLSNRIGKDPEAKAWLAERVAFEMEPANVIQVNPSPSRWHPTVSAIVDAMREEGARAEHSGRRLGIEGSALSKRNRPTVIRASALSRSFAILHAICNAAALRGFTTRYSAGQGRVFLAGHSAEVALRIVEVEDRDAPVGSQWLRLFIEAPNGRPAHEEDGESGALEARINIVFVRIYQQVIRYREDAAHNAAIKMEWASIERERRIQQARSEQVRKQQIEDKQWRERLLRRAALWKGVSLIEEYARFVEATALATRTTPSPALNKWLARARACQGGA